MGGVADGLQVIVGVGGGGGGLERRGPFTLLLFFPVSFTFTFKFKSLTFANDVIPSFVLFAFVSLSFELSSISFELIFVKLRRFLTFFLSSPLGLLWLGLCSTSDLPSLASLVGDSVGGSRVNDAWGCSRFAWA